MAAGAHILAPAGPELGPDERAFFREADPWGFILFERNCQTPDQLHRLTSGLRDAVGREAVIMIDQEGGRVQRMRAPVWREYLDPLDQVDRAGPDAAARAMYLRSLLIGADLREVGIDANCAPCADIARPETHPFLKSRCYGRSAAEVTVNARAVSEGLSDAGVLPVLKHAPGHGRAQADSHHHLPTIDAPLEELVDTDFRPFEALADLPMAMTAHLVLPEVDAERPITQSPRGIELLRQEIGLSGLLMTDDISMNALKGGVAERSHLSILAGCDVILHCNGELPEMVEVAAAAGLMTPAAAARGDAVLACRRAPEAIDIRAVEDELGALQTETTDA